RGVLPRASQGWQPSGKAGETVRLTRRIGGIAADGEDWRLSGWRPRRAQRPEKAAAILAGHAEIDEHGVEARAGSMRQRRWGTADAEGNSAFEAQILHEHLHSVVVIVDHEDGETLEWRGTHQIGLRTNSSFLPNTVAVPMEDQRFARGKIHLEFDVVGRDHIPAGIARSASALPA